MDRSIENVEMTSRHDSAPLISVQVSGNGSDFQLVLPQECNDPFEAWQDATRRGIVGNVGGFMVGSDSGLGSAGEAQYTREHSMKGFL